jgi:hypothetical protein
MSAHPGEYRLSSHGSVVCVSQHIYLQAGADVQRFAAGIPLMTQRVLAFLETLG